MQVTVPEHYLMLLSFCHFHEVGFFLGNEEVSSSVLMETSDQELVVLKWVLQKVALFVPVVSKVLELTTVDEVTSCLVEVVKSWMLLVLMSFEAEQMQPVCAVVQQQLLQHVLGLLLL